MESSTPPSLYPSHHFHPKGYPFNRMPKPSFSHDSQDHPCLSPWIPDDATCSSLHSSPAINVKSLHDLQPSDSSPYYRFAPDSPQTGSLLQLPSPPPIYYPDSFMDMSPELIAYKSLPHILTGQDHAFSHHQPPSPPDDTPELVQRELPRIGFSEPHSPPLKSPSDVDDLPPILDSVPSPSNFLRNLEHEPGGTKQRGTRHCCQSHYDNAGAASERAGLFPHGPQLSPEHHLLTPDSPSWTTSAFLDPDFCEDEPMSWSVDRSRGQATKARGNSLDSSQQDAYEFMAPVHRPLRSFTTPTPSSQQPSGQLGDLWDSDCASIDHHSATPSSRANLASFDLSFDDRPPDFPPSLLSHSPREDSLSFFDESYDDNAFENPVGLFPTGFEPSSPHSPHMQLLPDSEGPMDCQPTTIAPSLLGLPDSEIGLGLDVDGIDRSPSPSDYELQLLDGSTDVPLQGLSEEEFQGLRAIYEHLSRSEAAARERENVLDRRVKDISALLKPPKASPDLMVMLARRQELRAATDMRIEARKARKEEKRRLRELGALLDIKLDCAVFRSKGVIQSVPQLVADMVFKRHDRCRPLANRKAASYCRTHVPSPLRSSFTDDTIVSADDDSLMDSMSVDGSDEDERMTVM